jgi:hypothetical protein
MGRRAEANEQGAPQVMSEDYRSFHEYRRRRPFDRHRRRRQHSGARQGFAPPGRFTRQVRADAVNAISDEIGPALSHYYRIRFEPVDGKLVCVVEADAMSEGVFLKGDKGKEFFVRVGNTTRSLDPGDTHAYLAARMG